MTSSQEKRSLLDRTAVVERQKEITREQLGDRAPHPELTRHTEKLATVIKALDLVDELLDTRGMEPDCSARHNLAIARSLVKDVLSDDEVSK